MLRDIIIYCIILYHIILYYTISRAAAHNEDKRCPWVPVRGGRPECAQRTLGRILTFPISLTFKVPLHIVLPIHLCIA